MSVPDYASHLGEEKYEHWAKYWPHFGQFNEKNTPSLPQYYLPEIADQRDAAAFLMIAAMDDRAPQHDSLSFRETTLMNSGRDIGSVAALIQYQDWLAAEGLDLLMAHFFDPEQHGIEAWEFLSKASDEFFKNDGKHAKIKARTVGNFLDKAQDHLVMARVAKGYEGREFTPEREIFSSALAHALRYCRRPADEIEGRGGSKSLIQFSATQLTRDYLNHIVNLAPDTAQFSWEVLDVVDQFGGDQMIASYQDHLGAVTAMQLEAGGIIIPEDLSRYSWLEPYLPDLGVDNDSISGGPG